MTTVPPVTDTLARFVASADFSTISARACTAAKLHILDTLGTALAAVSTPVASIAIEYSRRAGGSGEASIWGTNASVSIPMAAFANGLLAHALDYDDWDAYIHAGHPTSMVGGAAMTLGEWLGASGKELLAAYIVGIEVIAKLAANAPNLHDRGFHSTPVWGSLGAAVAAARLLRLGPEKITAAIGIAASGCGGIHRQQGSMVKPFHAGNAARNGVEAALLAEKGFTADAAIIEAPRGFCDTFFGPATCDYEKMIDAVGEPYFLEAPGLGLKLHPCSAPQFLAADAALHIKREYGLASDEIEKIEVSIPPLRYQRHFHPEVKTGLRGKFAVNYVVALCMLDGKLEIASFTDEKANQRRVQEMLRKVRVIVDEAIPEPGTYCPVTVELKDGRRFTHTATIAKGHPKNPMTEDEVIAKFRGNAKERVREDNVEAVIAKMQRLEDVDHVRDIVELMKSA
jgi:2-methylcitrate dehydratase PrpD